MHLRRVWNGNALCGLACLIACGVLLAGPCPAEPDPLIRVSDPWGDSTNPRVAVLPGASEIYVVWQDQRPGAPGLYFRRFSPAGLPRTAAMRFHPDGSLPSIAVGSDGRARIAWLQGRAAYFTILEPDGQPFGDPQVVKQNVWEPSIAVGPENEATVVCEWQRLAVFHIFFSRFDATGTRMDCDGVLDEGTIFGVPRKKLAITADAAGFTEILSLESYGWMESSYRAALRTVHPEDCPPDAAPELLCEIPRSDYDCPAIAIWPPAPERTFAFWEEQVGNQRRIVSDSCQPLDRSTGNARRPRATCDSTQTATVVWYDDRDGNEEIYFARIGGDGQRVRPEDTRLTEDPARSRNPDVASVDARSVIVWEDNRGGVFDIYLTFTLPDCNGNGVADDVDVADQTSPDCNGNGTPDECDIAACRSLDADGDGVPDECLPGLRVDIIDPNPELLDGVCGPGDPLARCLSADLGRLAEDGRVVQGLAADGVTPIVIRVEAPAPGAVEIAVQDETGSRDPALVGQLQDFDENVGNPVTVQAHNVEDRWVALALLRAPVDFARGPNDDDAPERHLTLLTTLGDHPAAARSIRLVRPPLLLLHGLWSSAEGCWELGLEADPRFTVHAEDYALTNAAHFDRNILEVRVGAERTLRKLRRRCIAATQVDVIAHSMGGVLSRLHVGERRMTYRRAENFRRGDIHKLITLDTPHLGSPLADLLVTPNGSPTFLGIVFNAFGMCSDCGAVFDLRPGSDILLNLPPAPVPAHAIFGTGGSDLIEERLLPSICDALVHTSWPLCSILKVLVFFGVDLFPPELQHDLIVFRPSQEGGLEGVCTSRIGYVPNVSRGIHIGIGTEPETNRIAIDLLNAKVGDPVFSQTGFPPRRALRAEAQGGIAALGALPVLQGQGSLTIVSPAQDATVPAGTILTVTAEAGDGFQPESMLFVSSYAVVVVESPPFEAAIEIPATALGPTTIAAVGRDAEDNYLMSEQIRISVETTAEVTALRVWPAEIDVFAYAPQQSLTVTGLFDDGLERTVTPAGAGTTYRVLDPSIATVDENGIVRGESVGQTLVFVEHADSVAQVAVTVHSARGDRNSDGQVDAKDHEAFLACFSGPWDDPGFELPDVACRDFFDFDDDTDIDDTDLEAFLSLLPDPQDQTFSRADSNTDNTLDIADAMFSLGYLFGPESAPSCLDAADANDDGEIDISDAITTLLHLFSGIGPLPGPFGACGIDPTADELGCESFPPCEGQ